jgi:dUTP pyrophosphatase
MDETIEIQLIKLDINSQLPTKAHDGDNCWDVYAVERTTIPARGSATVNVGLKLAYITPGYGLVFKPRSGLGFKHDLCPHLGEIDSGYRGSLNVKVYNFGDNPYTFEIGDRPAQMKVEKVWKSTVSFVDNVVETARGEKGLGSTGK